MIRSSLLTFLLFAPGVAQDESRPNVLLILTDDMGFGDLAFQGSRQIATPQLDALAAGGVRMAQGYVTATVCAPSRAGLITGRYQNRFGFEHNLSYPDHVPAERVGLPVDEPTMGDRMKALGYRTALIGKWHLGEHAPEQLPNARGFDHFLGMRNGGHAYFPTPQKNHLWCDGEPVQEIRTPYLTDWFTLEAIDFVREASDQPWFLYLSYNTPHTPLQAKDEDLAHFEGVEPKQRRVYCAMQRNLDRNVGRLVAALRDSGQLDDTLIAFVNDNGGSCDASFANNAPLRGQKSTMLEGGVRVPFVLHWPGGLPAAEVYPHPISSLDLLPTFLAAAGSAMPEEWTGRGRKRKVYDGVDLLPFLRGERDGERPHEVLYWRMIQRGAAIRSGDWKLIRLPHRPPMLFDLATDVSELNDRAGAHPERVAAMLRELHEWECTFERNPMWVSGVNWATYNRKLYDRDYALEQPEPAGK